jgi:hypothetical protein
MIIGAAQVAISFPDDFGSGGMFRFSSVAILSGGTAALMTVLVAAPMVETWYWSCFIGVTGALFIGGMWGGIVGDFIGRFLRRLVGLAEGEFEGIYGLNTAYVKYTFTEYHLDLLSNTQTTLFNKLKYTADSQLLAKSFINKCVAQNENLWIICWIK